MQRQRHGAGAGGEEHDHEVVDRQRERHQRTGDDAEHDQRQRDVSERLARRGASNFENVRYIAIYVDKILNGARPGDLPVQQPTKFQLVIKRSPKANQPS